MDELLCCLQWFYIFLDVSVLVYWGWTVIVTRCDEGLIVGLWYFGRRGYKGLPVIATQQVKLNKGRHENHIVRPRASQKLGYARGL
jgi:hypothetical protein